MILRSSPFSPFGRKVKIAAHVLGLADRIEVVVADTNDPADSLRSQNPLGKIPILLLDDGSSLYDSRVIVEYLDHAAGGGRIIPHGEARFPVLRLQALADGILDASILRVYEARFRPEAIRSPEWVAYQADKVRRTLGVIETAPPVFDQEMPDIGAITLACALGYQDLRFDGWWRAEFRSLVAWLDAFAVAVPSWEKTKPA
jgi:glutathione S-transferase